MLHCLRSAIPAWTHRFQTSLHRSSYCSAALESCFHRWRTSCSFFPDAAACLSVWQRLWRDTCASWCQNPSRCPSCTSSTFLVSPIPRCCGCKPTGIPAFTRSPSAYYWCWRRMTFQTWSQHRPLILVWERWSTFCGPWVKVCLDLTLQLQHSCSASDCFSSLPRS